jgi:hypothetical protein
MAKRDVAGIVAGAGLLTSIFTEFAQAVYDRGGTAEDIHRLATPEGRAIIGKLAELTVCGTYGNTFILSIDYSRPLAEVVAAGNYNYADPNITEENFPTNKVDPAVDGNPTGVQGAVAMLVQPDCHIDSMRILGELDRIGLRPGSMFELAVFGEQHPEVQLKFPILAAGSVWTHPDGHRRVGYLWGDDIRRRLSHDYFDSRWWENCRFLAFRKECPAALGFLGRHRP